MARRDGLRQRAPAARRDAEPKKAVDGAVASQRVPKVIPVAFGLAPVLFLAARTLLSVPLSDDHSGRGQTNVSAQFCCFGPDDVNIVHIGTPPGYPVLLIDNFLCPDTLNRLVEDASRASWIEAWRHHAFPGYALPIRTWTQDGKAADGPATKLASGQHLFCLQEAVRHLIDRGRLQDVDEGLIRSMEISNDVTRAIVDSAGEAERGPLSEDRLKTLTRKAKSAGLYGDNVSAWAFLSLLNTETIRNHVEGVGGDSTRLTYVSRRPVSSDIHLDNARLVINVPLTESHEDTGTSFWQARPLPGGKPTEHCGIAPKELRHCIIARSRHHRKTQELRNALPPGQDMSFAHGRDDLEEFDQFYMLPFRKNRAAVYSGHIFHSSFISPRAEQRIVAGANYDLTQQRLMLQDFLAPPVLAAALLKRKLVEKDQDGLRRAAGR